MIDRLAGNVCGEPGRVYLEGKAGSLAGTIYVEIEGNFGMRGYLFAGGTALSEVVDAVNAYQTATGVSARIAPENSSRVESYSTEPGDRRFVSARQFAAMNQPPIVVNQAVGGTPAFEYTDYGCYDGVPCVEFAQVFLATGSTINAGGEHAVAFVIRGDFGSAAFAFLSGTTATNIANAINTMTNETAVVAHNYGGASTIENGVALRSVFPVNQSFVVVQQIGTPAMVYSAPGVGAAMSEFTDFGSDTFPGDINGDDVIDATDLSIVLADWGPCPPPNYGLCPGDLNLDGRVNIDDLVRIITLWGPGVCP